MWRTVRALLSSSGTTWAGAVSLGHAPAHRLHLYAALPATFPLLLGEVSANLTGHGKTT